MKWFSELFARPKPQVAKKAFPMPNVMNAREIEDEILRHIFDNMGTLTQCPPPVIEALRHRGLLVVLVQLTPAGVQYLKERLENE